MLKIVAVAAKVLPLSFSPSSMSDNDFFICDYFTLFGLPLAAADIDNDALEARYQSLQAAAHPDKFAAAANASKQAALQMSGRINDAYHTLKTPLLRCAYLLSLNNIQPFAEDNTAMPPDFLMRQIEWREALENADDAARQVILSDIADTCAQTSKATVDALARHNLSAATDSIRRWKYLQKILDEYHVA